MSNRSSNKKDRTLATEIESFNKGRGRKKRLPIGGKKSVLLERLVKVRLKK